MKILIYSQYILNLQREDDLFIKDKMSDIKVSFVVLGGSIITTMVFSWQGHSYFSLSQLNDGASSIIIGNHIYSDEDHRGPLAYIGGSCSVTGFDDIGDERFWTVRNTLVNTIHVMTCMFMWCTCTCTFDILIKFR